LKTKFLNNQLSDYEQILGLISSQLDLNPDYAIELLDVTSRQILLAQVRARRDAAKDHHDKIHYGKIACFYSEGDPDDLKTLADQYQQINELALAICLYKELEKMGLKSGDLSDKIAGKNLTENSGNHMLTNQTAESGSLSTIKSNNPSSKVMEVLYSENIWEGFQPSFPKEKIEGWNGKHPIFEELIMEKRPQVVIDVGVWKGLSTTTLAQSLKKHGIDGCVISIDTFLGSPEHWDHNRDLFKRRHGYPDLYEQFMANVFHAELSDYVIPMPQLSHVAPRLLKKYGIQASLIHVDAAHEYEEVLRDAIAYWDILEPGGIMVGDDYHPTWPGVVRAADEFAKKVRRELQIQSPKWILRK